MEMIDRKAERERERERIIRFTGPLMFTGI